MSSRLNLGIRQEVRNFTLFGFVAEMLVGWQDQVSVVGVCVRIGPDSGQKTVGRYAMHSFAFSAYWAFGYGLGAKFGSFKIL
jgi:hypothetical protein